jgi:gliding motility-associated-like protein
LVAENAAIFPGNTSSNDFMAIGGYIDDLQAVYHYFCGKIDDVRIYDRALCDEEIKDLSIYNCYDVLLSGETMVCQGDQQIIYRATSEANISVYTWQYSGIGAIINGNSDSVSIDFSETATSGILTVSVSGDGLTPKSFEFPITINPLPDAAGNISGDTNVCRDTYGYFYSVPEIGHSTGYQWDYSPMGVSFSGNSESIYMNFTPGATSGILTVRGINACGEGKTSSEMKIDLKLCNDTTSQPTFLLNIPNSFSPNGDGINDLFLIRGLPGGSALMIFDRRGKKVYETTNYQHNWGGADDEGHLFETGTYWYTIVVPGFSQNFKGFIYLKR